MHRTKKFFQSSTPLKKKECYEDQCTEEINKTEETFSSMLAAQKDIGQFGKV